MKKLLAMLLAAVMSFSLVACGGDTTSDNQSQDNQIEENNNDYSEVEKALVGQWGFFFVDFSTTARYFEFREEGHGNLLIYDISSTTASSTANWTVEYEITEDKIICEVDMGDGNIDTDEITYTFEDGNLTLSTDYYQKERELYKDDWHSIIEDLRKGGTYTLDSFYYDYVTEE